MKNIKAKGIIRLQSEQHLVEYEAGSLLGAGVLFFRLTNGRANVPIRLADIDSVINLLEAGKPILEALESLEQ